MEIEVDAEKEEETSLLSSIIAKELMQSWMMSLNECPSLRSLD
jgi:hypothetical protein